MKTRSAERPEFVRELAQADFGAVEKPLTWLERLYNRRGVLKALVVVMLALLWEIYARSLDNSLLFPTLSATLTALFEALVHGDLINKIWASVRVLLVGYAAGLALSAVMITIAMSSRLGDAFLETATSMFNPLPAVALIPLAMIWFGLGSASTVFVLVHAVLWPVSLNTHSGFLAVSPTLRMVGRNYGLTGIRFITQILIPAAFPSILTGLKIGWAFAWRTLIAAELVFGVSTGSGGLGWFIYEKKNFLEIPSVFAGLLTVVVLGLIIEGLIFGRIERRTTRRWGMQT
jgi:NitT/TauT family transport system permease protein